MAEFVQVGLAQMGLSYAQTSVVLTTAQANGTDPIVAAKADRQGLKLVVPADCRIATASGAAIGLPAFNGVAWERSGPDCPTNAIYVLGLFAGAIVGIWEA